MPQIIGNVYEELQPITEQFRKADGTTINLTEFLADLVSRMTEVAIDSGTATGGSATTLADTNRNWEVDKFIGGWAEIVIGTKHYIREITDNDATSITFATLGVSVTAGTLYSIKRTVSLSDIVKVNGTSQTPGDWTALLTSISTAGLSLGQYDEVQITYPDTVTEVYTFKLATVTTHTVTLTYSDATKVALVSVVRA
jgi:small ligand-binding sensory domain FIST